MKKLLPLFLFVALLIGCTGPLPDITQLLTTPTLVPTDTNTPAPTVTLIPTRDLFATLTSTPVTYTPTETPLVEENTEPTATFTPFLLPTIVPPLNEMAGSNFFTPHNEGIERVLTSATVIYWNAGPCLPRNIKINVIVTDPDNTSKVLLFMRLREKKNTLNVTDWNSGAILFKETDGSFSYDLRTFNIIHYYYFKDAWIEYQFVAIDKNLEVIGRTPIYDRKISLVKCNPIP